MPGGVLVVLIHGSLDRSAGMARVARALASRAAVLRYDRRGYGRSWPHAGPFSLVHQVDDLERCLAGRSAVLIGHSYGGNIALAAAERLGDQILGVSTYETPLSWLDWWPGDSAGAIGVAAGPEMAAERFLVRLVGEKVWGALPERTKSARRREGVALVGELGSLRTDSPWDPAAVRCRVLCGVGSKAREHHRQGAEWLVSHLPRAELMIIESAGHGAPNSHPLEYARVLVDPHLVDTAGARPHD